MEEQDHGIAEVLDWKLLAAAKPALEKQERVSASFPVKNTDRTIGTILSNEISKKYKGEGLPDGTLSVLTKYRRPGLRVRIPERVGFWEFESAAKLYYHGKLFAVVGTAKGVNGKGDGYLGYVTSMVIYDEDGDGQLESPVNVNDGNGLFLFHLPGWVTR